MASLAKQSLLKATPRKPRTTKLDIIVKLLTKPKGASLAELSNATGWQQYSVRGALAGVLKKKGFNVHSDIINNVRRYRISLST